MVTAPPIQPDIDLLAPAELGAIRLVLEEVYDRLMGLSELMHERCLGGGSMRKIDEADVGRICLAMQSADSLGQGIAKEATDVLGMLCEVFGHFHEALGAPEYRRALETLADPTTR